MSGAPPKVFISYSHDTVEHQERVLGLADRLRADGIDAEIDQYNAAPSEGWPLWCERQIHAAAVVLMICTETYHRRVSGDEERGKGMGVAWEAGIIRQLLYEAGAISDKFVPVLFSDASPEQIPTPIKGWSRYVVDTKDGYENLYRRLSRQDPLRPALGKIRPLPRRPRLWPPTETPNGTGQRKPFNGNWDEDTLPRVLDFVGRDRELRKLDDYFSNDIIAICNIVAGPGTGKTALVSRWLDKFDGSESPRKVIRSFSEPDGSPTPIDADFATVFYKQPTVLVLDGFAPFGEWRGGNQAARNAEFVPDPASSQPVEFRMLLHDIQKYGDRGNNNRRLVIITSREPLASLFRLNSYGSLQLHGLSDDEGAALLRKRGLSGGQKDLEKASYQLCGHPLALILFPEYIKAKYNGDVQRALNMDKFFSDILSERIRLVEKWADTVISYYSERWEDDDPEKIFLQMMSLVHRELKTPELDALMDNAELTVPVRRLRESDWSRCYRQLEESGLILPQESGSKGRNCHPVIRTYMREGLRREKPDLWKNAHNVLFEHFKSIGRPEPRTSEELLNVYRTITHGCHAGRYGDAYKIYHEKCLKGARNAFSTNSVGSFADDAIVLRLLSRADIKQSGLSEENRAIVYGRLAFCYTCLGWLGDAIPARHQELEIWKSNPLQDSRKSIIQYAASVAELSSVYLYRGSLSSAERYAREAMEKADQCEDWWTRMRSRVRKALVEYIKKNIEGAQRLFEEAEEIQLKGDEKKRPVLYGEEGWFYNIFLLDTKCKSPAEVEERCKDIQCAHGAAEESWVVMDGLNLVALGEAILGQDRQERQQEGCAKLREGLTILYNANSQVHLVLGLLRQARVETRYGEVKKARKIIAEAIKITNNYELPYFRANAYIYDVRNAIMAMESERSSESKEYFQEASSRVDEINGIVRDYSYFLREKDVSALEQDISKVRTEAFSI